MLRPHAKHVRRDNGMAKEMAMTRSDVKKLAWSLRLIGYGMLVGAVALMFLGTQHALASSAKPASTALVK
jgi:hypothetical protein